MIICPKCHHQEINGAIYCSECGAPLVSLERVQTNLIVDGKSEPQESTGQTSMPTNNEDAQVSPLSLLVVQSGQVLHLAGRSEYSLGRAAEGQPILPDIDLTPYDAYSMGVSRIHATLRWINKKIYIMDLGSSNGTRINGQKILPQIDFPIKQGDVISFGRLKIQIFIHLKEEEA